MDTPTAQPTGIPVAVDVRGVYAITFVVAACSLLYELLLAQTLSALLGNTVVRYSITIGCYLGALGVGAMLCERHDGHPAQRLARIELALSLVGGLSVPCLYTLDMIQNWAFSGSSSLAGTQWPYWGFLACSHLLIAIIGVLSGFEIPLLLALGEQGKHGSSNRVLGFDYLGSLAASVLFPLWLLRSLGLLTSGIVVGLTNAVVLVAVMIAWRGAIGRSLRLRTTAAIGTLSLIAAYAVELEEHFLDKLYFQPEDATFLDLFQGSGKEDRVQHFRSPYQQIDIITTLAHDQWIYDLLSTKRTRRPDYPVDTWLYLDRAYQLFSGMDEFYHEWFVHVPVQATGRAPERLLVIGGGDGLAVRTALSYPSVREVVQVELDPTMIELAKSHPKLSRMNDHVYDDPRVTLVLADGFQWLRRERSRFDGIYIDVPYAKDYNLSLVYSREFYATALRHLEPGGFLAMDAPGGLCGFDDELWNIYHATLRAAGFATVVPFITEYSAESPQLQQRLLDARGGALSADVNARAHDWATEQLGYRLADLPVQEFILALPEGTSIDHEYDDLGVETAAFDAHHYALALQPHCSDVAQTGAAWVNSVARPRLPPLDFHL